MNAISNNYSSRCPRILLISIANYFYLYYSEFNFVATIGQIKEKYMKITMRLSAVTMNKNLMRCIFMTPVVDRGKDEG